MPNPQGSFIWYELMTDQPDAAARFYGSVVGWRIADAPAEESGGTDYRMIGRSDGGHAGGVFKLTDDMKANGALPTWLPYFYAADVDTALAAIIADGGSVMVPAFDIPVGRIAMCTDPQGVPFYLMRPVPPAGVEEQASDVFTPETPQRANWNELASPDLAASKAFYAKHMGFAFNESMPMGPMGDYCFIDHAGQRLGAIMQRSDERTPARWLTYFGVPSITAAKAAVEAGGGTIVAGPMEVPGGAWIVVALDPQGAGFGLVGAKGE